MKLNATYLRCSVTLAAALAAFVPTAHLAIAQNYGQTNLVTDNQANLIADGYAPAAFVDPTLVNPWGIAESGASPFWVSDNNGVVSGPNATGAATLYNTLGVKNTGVIVNVSNPTGQAYTGGLGLTEPGTTTAPSFIFAGDTGVISAWAGSNGTTADAAYINSNAKASYTGIAVDKSSAGEDVYAADTGLGTIDVFNSSFAPTTVAGSFTDPTLAAGLSPFNIQNLAGNLFVTYVGAAGGAVAEFDPNGNFISQLAANGAVGPLNAPWGLALAPVGFGQYGGDLLVGNFGNGEINAFNAGTGAFQGTLDGPNGAPLVNSGLWGLQFGNGGNGGAANTLYFAAGINNENHGLFGSIAPVVPETNTFALLGLSLLPLLAVARRHRSA